MRWANIAQCGMRRVDGGAQNNCAEWRLRIERGFFATPLHLAVLRPPLSIIFSNIAPYKILITLGYLNFAVCLLLFANLLNSAQNIKGRNSLGTDMMGCAQSIKQGNTIQQSARKRNKKRDDTCKTK
jgi:hypothetical protein